jgi:FAD/FMN-containing dehydrogenase
VYVNFVDNDEGDARVRAAYGSRYDRLAGIKARYDPDNFFCGNQNIPPATGPPSGSG